MSDNNLGFDIDPVESAFVSEDCARMIEQLQEWFQMKRDNLEKFKSAEEIVLMGETITDPKTLSGFKLGIHAALLALGETLPVSVDHKDGE